MITRRTLMTTGAMSGAVLATAGPQAFAAGTRRRLGLQLFTVMTALEQDFEGTLKTVASIGYREVETIGSFGRDPKLVRELLDRHDLVSPSQHLMPGNLYANFLRFTRREIAADDVMKSWQTDMAMDRIKPNVQEAIERAQVLGQRHICLQIIWPHQMQSREALADFCAGLDTAGELCNRAGMHFNFHNHADEFKTVGDFVPYDVILASTDPNKVKLELDVYWAVRAGVDPIALLRKHGRRYQQLHLKDATASGDFATVGQGVIDFPGILRAARRAGAKHAYVEYDRADDPMAVTREAYAYLSKLL